MGIVIGLLSLWIIWYFTSPMFSALSLRIPRTRRLRKSERHIAKADDLMNEGKFFEALGEIKKSIILDILKSEEAVFRTREHHQNLLSRCLVIGEQLGSRFDNLPQVERLVNQRGELMLLLLKAESSYSNFVNKRKDAPDWSKKDYQKKVAQVKSELTTNKAELVKELDKLFKALKSPSEDENVTYH